MEVKPHLALQTRQPPLSDEASCKQASPRWIMDAISLQEPMEPACPWAAFQHLAQVEWDDDFEHPAPASTA